MKRNHVKVPNRLITDDSLSYSARKLGAVLYSRRNHLGSVSKSLESLAKLTGMAISTVRKALAELEQSEFLTGCKQYKYDKQKGRFVYKPSLYSIDMNFEGGFTFVPRTLFRKVACMGGSEVAVCLYLYFQTGNNNRAFPSLKNMSAQLKMAKSTVCRVIKTLGAIGMLLIQKCRKVNNAFSHNSYFFIRNWDSQVVFTPVDNQANSCLPMPHKEVNSKLMIGRLFYPPATIIKRIAQKINMVFRERVVRKTANKYLRLR